MSRAHRGGARAPEVPSLAHILSIFAFHVQSLATDRPTRTDAPYCERARFGLGLGGFKDTDCPFAWVREVEITPSRDLAPDDPWGAWAQVTFDGQPQGNRCGATDAYARLCAPVLAWVAHHWSQQTSIAAHAVLTEVK